jgi:D-alanyl-D-alanine carboxypeptidase
MNDKASYFKLKNTRFSEMAGLNPNNVTTAEEMAVLAHRAFSSFRIAEPSVKTSYSFTVTDATGAPRTIQVTNRNYSLLTFKPDAAKTGYLTEAQRNVALKKNGHIIVVMHALSMKQRNQSIQKLLP